MHRLLSSYLPSFPLVPPRWLSASMAGSGISLSQFLPSPHPFVVSFFTHVSSKFSSTFSSQILLPLLFFISDELKGFSSLAAALRHARHIDAPASVYVSDFYNWAAMCAVLRTSSRLQHVPMIWDKPGSCLCSPALAPLLHHRWLCSHNCTGTACRREYSLAQG